MKSNWTCYLSSQDIYTCAGLLQQNNSLDLPRHNIVALIAQEQKLHILPALGKAKDLCSSRLRQFSTLQDSLLHESPSSATGRPNAVSDITIYTNALGDCIRGIVHWACESERFFGKDGLYSTLVVQPSGGTDVQEEVAEAWCPFSTLDSWEQCAMQVTWGYLNSDVSTHRDIHWIIHPRKNV